MTDCPVCGVGYQTDRGLKIHYARSGHGQRARAQVRAQAMMAARRTPRPIPCTSCGATFGSKVGLRIHQSLLGHQPPKDQFEQGDGPASVRRTRKNAIPTRLPPPKNY
jgi:hypothetical protein